MLKTYHGSCHCGAVKFEADLDLSAGTGKCNCSYCAKTRGWGVVVKPDALRVLQGEDAQTDYQFGTRSAHHLFCRTCGVTSFGRGYVEQIGGAYAFVNLAALDDAELADLAEAPVRFMNGRDNKWFEPPSETRYM